MQGRYRSINVPIEVVRTLVSIADLGSFSRAGERLGLSQPAISAQVKRLNALVGGPVFERVPGGVAPTERGKLVVKHARRLLQCNDQILLIGGASCEPGPVRLGISPLLAEAFLDGFGSGPAADVLVKSWSSEAIGRGLADGFIDLGCLLDPPGDLEPIAEWHEELVWLRSPGFTLSPGAPIPLVGCPGVPHDDAALQALQQKGMAYKIAFESTDRRSRARAVQLGIGLMAASARQIEAGLVVAREYYLPVLPKMRVGICAREGFNPKRAQGLVDRLLALEPRSPAAIASNDDAVVKNYNGARPVYIIDT